MKHAMSNCMHLDIEKHNKISSHCHIKGVVGIKLYKGIVVLHHNKPRVWQHDPGIVESPQIKRQSVNVVRRNVIYLYSIINRCS